jgi:hypothetical protein
MNWKGCGRNRSWVNLKSYPGICLEGLSKTTVSLSQDSFRSSDQDIDAGVSNI